MTTWCTPDPQRSQKAASRWPHQTSAQTRSTSNTCPAAFSLLKPSCALSQLRVPLSALTNTAGRAAVLLRPRFPSAAPDCCGFLLGHGGGTWASKPLRSKVSSLETAGGIGFNFLKCSEQSPLLEDKPQSPTLAFIPAHRPLPSKSPLPESAVGAGSVHLCACETGQRNRKIQPPVKAGWESPLRWARWDPARGQ